MPYFCVGTFVQGARKVADCGSISQKLKLIASNYQLEIFLGKCLSFDSQRFLLQNQDHCYKTLKGYFKVLSNENLLVCQSTSNV